MASKQKQLINYFLNINASLLVHFEHYWQQIERHQLNSKELGLILHKTAKVPFWERRPIEDYIKKEIAIWEEKAIKNIEDFDPQSLSLSLWATAKLRVNPSHDFLEAWQGQALKKIDKFNPQNLTNSLWALSTMGIIPSQEFFNVWQERATQIMQMSTSQDLAKSIKALAILGHAPTEEFIVKWCGNMQVVWNQCKNEENRCKNEVN